MNLIIRRFRDTDSDEISNIICRNFREVNSKDYPSDIIENLVKSFSPDNILRNSRQQYREMFVAEADGTIAGTASLARDNRTEDENYICLTVFVLPEYHGAGIGTQLMNQVEESARSKGAKVLRVPASLTALSFYRKQGYTEDPTVPSDPQEGCIHMIKSFQ